MSRKLINKNGKWLKFLFVFFLLFLLIISFYFFYKNRTVKLFYEEKDKLLKEETIKQFKYDSCINELVDNDEINMKKDELKNYIINKYPNTSIKYYDIKTKMDFVYNENEIYYGASLIKALTALYIYDMALKDPTILDDVMIYKSNYIKAYSLEMEKIKIGEEVKIRDLLKYSISVSDNSAHFMLVDYIGFNTLKEYGNSIGNKNTLIGSDIYGNIDLNDAFNYMFLLYDYLAKKELNIELIEPFNNDYFNYLKIDNTEVLHKYGYHNIYFHDIGIVLDKKPYIIVVLTKYGLLDKESIVKDISQKIREFHDFYKDKIEKTCNK